MFSDNLFGEEFPLDTRDVTSKLLKKTKEPKVVKSKKIVDPSLALQDKLLVIKSEVHRILGKYKDNTIVIKTQEEFINYIDACINNGVVTIDTETNNSLDPLTCKLMGLCLYTPNLKQAYVPVNHVELFTKERLSWQLNEQQICEQLQRLVDNNIKIIFHNAKFDYQVIKSTCGIELPIYWDTMIAAKLLDENEKAGLKEQYRIHIDSSQEKYDIEHLFKKLSYDIIDVDLFALYAATDSFITYKLYEYQELKFKDPSKSKVFNNVFMELEMPLIRVVAEMELKGIELDLDYSKKLSDKYHALLDGCDAEAQEELLKLKPKIDAWRLTPDANFQPSKKGGEGVSKSKSEQLSDPINLSSPSQLAILFYDILEVKPFDKKSPRGTGEEQMDYIAKKYNFKLCDIILKKRELDKLLGTYIDKLPSSVNQKDNRLHANFNQNGTNTGRFSSSSPNLQNIPSGNKEIRLMFKARDGYVFCGSDYSGQEVKLTAYLSNDETMKQAYNEGKDLYSVIASLMFNNKYEDNLQFYPEGTKLEIDGQVVICGNKTHTYEDGKARRSSAKTVLLGLLYGRGAASIGEQLGKGAKEGQEIINTFFKSFPTVEKWINKIHKDVKVNGYVEDYLGRRRHLPDIMLNPYVVTSANTQSDFNPIIGCANRVIESTLEKEYLNKCNKIKYNKDFEVLKQEARLKGINIQANTNKIAQAERQSVNAIVQGSAASLTKKAMLNIFYDKELNDLGFSMLVTVHDEVFGECPIENSDKVAERLTKVMIDTALNDGIDVPMSCDAYLVDHWYLDEQTAELQDEYKKLIDKGALPSNALNNIVKKHPELDSNSIYECVVNQKLLTI